MLLGKYFIKKIYNFKTKSAKDGAQLGLIASDSPLTKVNGEKGNMKKKKTGERITCVV